MQMNPLSLQRRLSPAFLRILQDFGCVIDRNFILRSYGVIIIIIVFFLQRIGGKY